MSRYTEIREMNRIQAEKAKREAEYLAWLKAPEAMESDEFPGLVDDGPGIDYVGSFDQESFDEMVRDDMMGKT